MFPFLPSLQSFTPKFYTGSASELHLPFLYDLVAITKPKLIVVVGCGDGQVFLTLCQSVRENSVQCRCVALRMPDEHSANGDEAWRKGSQYCDEFYGDFAGLSPVPVGDFAAKVSERSVDFLLLDDCDSGAEIRAQLALWQTKLSSEGLTLIHGIDLERADSPSSAWNESREDHLVAEFHTGIGLGITTAKKPRQPSESLFEILFGKGVDADRVRQLYDLASNRVIAQARAEELEKRAAALEARQLWLDSVLTDRWKAQQVMDHQARAIAEIESKLGPLQLDREKAQEVIDWQAEQLKEMEDLRRDLDALRRDRAKAQLVMDWQHDQLQTSAAEAARLEHDAAELRDQIKEQKKLISAAKGACRKDGKCFHIQTGPKQRRTIGEKIARELGRLPRNLGLVRRRAAPAKVAEIVKASERAVDPAQRYAGWIAQHEPDSAELDEQRRSAGEPGTQPKFSLLVPVYNTPGNFLDEMFASVASQTYANWELCVVDANSSEPSVNATLLRWGAADPRIRITRLTENFGISDNTNRAMAMATGDFIACIDHDDLLAPFALFEMAQAISAAPGADIFYSDEDRLGADGKRHSPFFKPEWDPELLCASMYIGHLTAYRRSLANELGGFRKEFDLSQDYDFALRATERAKRIAHVPHVLYHWREHPASGSTGGKPDARKANLAALADAMRRRNLPAEVIEYPTANRARLLVEKSPRVSVIVPTDSAQRAHACFSSLPTSTKYPDLEIIVVTNSRIAEPLKQLQGEGAVGRVVIYDKAFNFSEKCNLGAAAAGGDVLIFFNDDVEPQEPDWIQNLIEPLENSEIGGVSPKLLYETGKIQYAGMVTGVRGLLGTAFHQRDAAATEHFNLAQSMRGVSVLSGACLAMRRHDFLRLEGFDQEHTPIAHSDSDLSFRIRESGLRCVYTPYTTLRHVGHASIGAEEKKQPEPQREKSSVYMMKRWAGFISHDPYFTENMRDWLHVDSPTPIRMSGRNDSSATGRTVDLLFVTHDLSLSGAPMMLFHAAGWCRANGFSVVVMSPVDGPLRGKLEADGIPLIVDPLIMTVHESFRDFARGFDCVVANTILSGPIIHAAKAANVPVAWWLHEPESVGQHYIGEDARLRSALPLADVIFAPSEQTASVYRPYTDLPVTCLPNAITDLRGNDLSTEKQHAGTVRVVVLGTVEPRKGQEVFAEALTLLPSDVQAAASFEVVGRVMDPIFGGKVRYLGTLVKNFSMSGARPHAQATQLLVDADVVVFPSRDEAMPTVTMLEAMSLGKAIVTTSVGGALEFLRDGDNALLVRPEDAVNLADALKRTIEDPALLQALARRARETYEERFTIEKFGPRFRDLIMRAIEKPAVGKIALTK